MNFQVTAGKANLDGGFAARIGNIEFMQVSSNFKAWMTSEKITKDDLQDEEKLQLIKEQAMSALEISEKVFDELVDQQTGNNVVRVIDVDPDLRLLKEINEQHVFIKADKGASIAFMKYSEVTEKDEIDFTSMDQFHRIWRNRKVEYESGNGRIYKMEAGKWWENHERRNEVESVIFDPKLGDNSQGGNFNIVEKNGKKYLNLWRGFSVQPAKGDWSRTKKHIYKILCNGDRDKFKYVIRWLAWAVQNPHERATVALVFKGEKGAGKSLLFVEMKKIFGTHGMVITDPSRLTGKFNSHLRKLSFLFCDEVYWPGQKEVEGIIKARITEPYIDVEAKWGNPDTMVNRLHIGMATNNDWVAPVTKDERRYFIEAVDNRYAKNNCSDAVRKAYFGRLVLELDSGGREAMLHDLLNMDLDMWHPRDDVPDTEEMNKQKELSLGNYDTPIVNLAIDGELPYSEKVFTSQNKYWVKSRNKECPELGMHNFILRKPAQNSEENRFGRKLREFGVIMGTKEAHMTEGNGGIFPSLAEFRKNVEAKLGVKMNWDTSGDEKWVIVKPKKKDLEEEMKMIRDKVNKLNGDPEM